MAKDNYTVYLLYNNIDIVYIGITNDIGRRMFQHSDEGKITYTGHKVLINGLDLITAELIESVLIQFGAMDLMIRLKNKNYNVMHHVFKLDEIRKNRKTE